MYKLCLPKVWHLHMWAS